jgi:fructokinase
MSVRIGIDMGGTKIECIVIGDGGAELWRKRVPTPQGDYAGTIAAVVELVANAREAVGAVDSIGIGTPGSSNPQSGLHRNANSTCLNGQAFERDLAKALGSPCTMANDANCFALSEAVDGAGADGRIVFGVILGTGCGGGVVIDKKVVAGHNLVAGEWGHTALPRRDGQAWEPRPCYCGRNDCLEQYLSGSAIEAEFTALTGETAHVTELVTYDHPEAAACLERFKDRLARSLAMVVDILDPDVVVLGGGVSNLEGLAEETQARLPDHVFSDACTTSVRVAMHGDSSGVRGAAWL